MKKTLIILFILLPALLASVIFIKPDAAVSEKENRALATRQSVTTDIIGGGFQSGLEQFLSDQLPLREPLVSLYANAQYFLGKREIGGAYLLKNKRLVQKITEADVQHSSLISYAKRVNALAKTYPVTVMYVPSAEICLRDSLPYGAPTYDYPALFGELKAELPDAQVIDLLPTLQGREDAFYRTDHHWTYDGARLAYQQWCTAHQYVPRQYKKTEVSRNFRGTLYQKVLMESIPYDSIFVPEIKAPLTVTADGKPIDFYNENALQGSAQYDVFQGGNHGVVTIENPYQPDGKTLLILKDSFANSLVPFLAEDYGKIVLLDERYTFLSLEDFVRELQPDEIAVIREIIN